MRTNYRPAWLFLGIAVPLVLALLILARGDDGSSFENVSTAHKVAPEQVTPETAIVALVRPAEEQSTAPSSTAAPRRSDEVSAIVGAADIEAIASSAPSQPSGATQAQSTPQVKVGAPPATISEPIDATTTTTTDSIGICVFDSGAIASSVRESACPGFFTQDPEQANKVATELRSRATTTTQAPATTATPTVAPLPTAPTPDTEPTPVTIAAPTDSSSTTITVPASTTTTTTTTKRSGRGRGKDHD